MHGQLRKPFSKLETPGWAARPLSTGSSTLIHCTCLWCTATPWQNAALLLSQGLIVSPNSLGFYILRNRFQKKTNVLLIKYMICWDLDCQFFCVHPSFFIHHFWTTIILFNSSSSSSEVQAPGDQRWCTADHFDSDLRSSGKSEFDLIWPPIRFASQWLKPGVIHILTKLDRLDRAREGLESCFLHVKLLCFLDFSISLLPSCHFILVARMTHIMCFHNFGPACSLNCQCAGYLGSWNTSSQHGKKLTWKT